jgi:hypothetical protein
MADFSGQKNIDKEKAFWSKVDKKESYECWEYKEYKDVDGYGRFNLYNGPIGAHVYAWELSRKCKTPEGKMILHMCDNRSCCNPNHLYCGDALQNAKDRMERGIKVPAHILANPALYEGEIWLIRRLLSHKITQDKIAKMFKVHQSTISHINTSKEWLCKEGVYA